MGHQGFFKSNKNRRKLQLNIKALAVKKSSSFLSIGTQVIHKKSLFFQLKRLFLWTTIAWGIYGNNFINRAESKIKFNIKYFWKLKVRLFKNSKFYLITSLRHVWKLVWYKLFAFLCNKLKRVLVRSWNLSVICKKYQLKKPEVREWWHYPISLLK